MKRALSIFIMVLVATFSLGAQGRGRGRTVPPAMPTPHASNAPAGTPHASPDRDFGRDRAADVGRGKQKGLEKTPSSKSKVHKGKSRSHHPQGTKS